MCKAMEDRIVLERKEEREKEKLEIAYRMIEKGFDINTIIELVQIDKEKLLETIDKNI